MPVFSTRKGKRGHFLLKEGVDAVRRKPHPRKACKNLGKKGRKKKKEGEEIFPFPGEEGGGGGKGVEVARFKRRK